MVEGEMLPHVSNLLSEEFTVRELFASGKGGTSMVIWPKPPWCSRIPDLAAVFRQNHQAWACPRELGKVGASVWLQQG